MTTMVTLETVEVAWREVAELKARCESAGAFSVSPTDLDEASKRVRQLADETASVRGPWHERTWSAARIAAVRAAWLLHYGSQSSGIPGFILALFLGVGGLLGVLLAGAILGIPPLECITAAILALLITFTAAIVALAAWPRNEAQGRLDDYRAGAIRRRNLLSQLDRQRHDAEDEFYRLRGLLKLRDQYEAKRQYFESLQAAFNDRRNQLLAMNWRSFRGVGFENYLAEVFKALGYTVELTKASGDQGADLILTRGPVRIAVQAKGYDGSVGNSAVQESFAGMAHYRCTRCAVVTNSEFTVAAIQLAVSTNCLLIDGSRIPSLVRGEVL